MSTSKETISVLLFTLVFTFLFHHQSLGLNLLIAETLLFVWLWQTKQFEFKGFYPKFLALALGATSIATVVTHSVFSYFLNFIILFLFVGMLAYPATKSLLFALGQGISNLFDSQAKFLEDLAHSEGKGKYVGKFLWRFRIYLIPIIVIFVFVGIYSLANPDFSNLTGSVVDFIEDILEGIFSRIDFSVVLTLLLCLVISIFLLKRRTSKLLVEIDEKASDSLSEPKTLKEATLKNEFQAGVFLLVVLNAILLILNVMEINLVWFGFEWKGHFLKGFVHDATYLLIFSILISITVVWYFFRGGLNFYPKNRFLKLLSYAWILQNGILVLSVAIRNYWYIYHFNLAYKRIGVMLFLVVTLYGLYTVFIKVRKRKSAFYLFKANTFVLVLVLTLSSLINWDTLIAKYNFSHAQEAFLHLDYMADLSDKALPYLQTTLPELETIDAFRKQKFPFVHDELTPEIYLKRIHHRNETFKQKWEQKSFLEWNWAEYSAYRKLTMSH